MRLQPSIFLRHLPTASCTYDLVLRKLDEFCSAQFGVGGENNFQIWVKRNMAAAVRSFHYFTHFLPKINLSLSLIHMAEKKSMGFRID